MPRHSLGTTVKTGFELTSCRIPIASIKPLRRVADAVKADAEVPPNRRVHTRDWHRRAAGRCAGRSDPWHYLLLEGHLRLEVLKEVG